MFLNMKEVQMIYNFSDRHQRFQYQNQSSLVSPGNEHYVRSHRYSRDPLRGIIMNIPSVLLFHLVSFADAIVTANTFPIFFLHTISCELLEQT